MSFYVGAEAIDRAETLDTSSGWWNILHCAVASQVAPCAIGTNQIGHLTDFYIYLTAATTGLWFGTARPTNVANTYWVTRDAMAAAVSGSVGPGLVHVSGQDVICMDGDRIVAYAQNLHVDMGNGGDGYCIFKDGYNPLEDTTTTRFATVTSGKTLSLYATGYVETPTPSLGQYTKYERNELNDDSSDDFSSTNHVCQTFTVGTSHNVHQIDVKLIRTAACGDVTLGVYNTSSLGSPTGSALASVAIDQSVIPEDVAAWVQFRLTTPLRLNSTTKYAIVLSAAAAGGWARYEAVGSYTSGEIWESTDSGATWTKAADSDLLFREYGLRVSSYGSYKVQLYPRAEGTFTQLVPAYNFQPATIYDSDIENWSCVDDLVNAPDEGSTAVMFALRNVVPDHPVESWENFLSGETEDVAGHLKSSDDASYNLWQSAVNGLTSPGNSLFEQYLQVGDILRSPTHNEWLGKYISRMSRVLSIEDTQNLTLAEDPGITFNGYLAPDPKKAWYVTPCSRDTADNPPDPGEPVAPNNLPFNYLEGTWEWEQDSDELTGSGGNAEDVLIYPSAVHRAFTEGLGWRPNTTTSRCVDVVIDDNTVQLTYDYSWADRTDPTGLTNYISYTFKDEYGDEATETQWSRPTKRDSYALKATLNRNPILEVQVVMRVCVALYENPTWSSITGTAQPFLTLDGIDALGEEVTIDSVTPMGKVINPGGYVRVIQPTFFTIRQTIARPGGGAWTRDDINKLEVGIILGNLGGTVKAYAMGQDPINAPAGVACTQLYADIVMSRTPQQPDYSGYAINQNGLRVFDNGFTEWGLPAFDFEMDQGTAWIFRSFIRDFVARPITVLRSATSKWINRHRTSRSLGRGATSKTV